MSSRRLFSMLALVAAALVGCGNPQGSEPTGSKSSSISDGTSDFTHTNVGAVLRRDPTSGLWRLTCSGTLVAPKVFLTAGHCMRAERMAVTFIQNIAPGNPIPADAPVFEGTAVRHPNYVAGGDGSRERFDYMVLLLDEAPGLPLATLPSAGVIDQLAKNGTLSLRSDMTAVGYGLAENNGMGGGSNYWALSNERRRAQMDFNALTGKSMIKATRRLGGDGTVCFGDSGGPLFYTIDGVETLVGTATIGDASCSTLYLASRTDLAQARDFLAPYVTLP
ncbi:MAG: trypsin-like serine protease [Deltaproteobacteria bacterium]|nr:trypsin-like serine protease [Deltaproteobacteria bacterium]